MKRTFVFLGLSVILAIATLAQGISFTSSKVCKSYCHDNCSKSTCDGSCTASDCSKK